MPASRGLIPDEVKRLGHQCQMTIGELEACCELWYEQKGDGWVYEAISTLTDRAREMRYAPTPEQIAKVLAE